MAVPHLSNLSLKWKWLVSVSGGLTTIAGAAGLIYVAYGVVDSWVMAKAEEVVNSQQFVTQQQLNAIDQKAADVQILLQQQQLVLQELKTQVANGKELDIETRNTLNRILFGLNRLSVQNSPEPQ